MNKNTILELVWQCINAAAEGIPTKEIEKSQPYIKLKNELNELEKLEEDSWLTGYIIARNQYN